MTDEPVDEGGRSTGPHQLEMPGWISCAPFEELLAMTIVEAANGEAVLTMPFYRQFAQGAGLLHGGALVSLADTAVVMAIKSIVPPKSHFATISLQTRFLYPVKQGVVTAKAKVLKSEDRLLHGEATVLNDEGRPVLEFASVFKLARRTQVEGVSFADQ
ncbi:MAG: PaaI family thioesterase [Deltaproteobacteria bacterium]|nr:PaaI family thioesterase [Candidatus Anaeroferrophillus wilburensis]MBN2888948.1 PaaI family thioesterase [Deltaproteobacteria bacterium]